MHLRVLLPALLVFSAIAAAPPRVCAQSLMEEAPVPPIDTSRKQAVIDAYRAYFLTSESPSPDWTGSLNPVNPGTTSLAFRKTVLQRINWYRRMAGSGSNVVFDPQLNVLCQAGALMISAANAYTPYPPSVIPTTWPGYTPEGAMGAQNSILQLDLIGSRAIESYMADLGQINVGHRIDILRPSVSEMGTGDVPTGTAGPGANILYTNRLGATVDRVVAWPNIGYAPILTTAGSFFWPRYWSYDLFYRDTFNGVSFGTAQLLVRKNGSTLQTNVVGRGGAIIWEMLSDAPRHGDVYEVRISDVTENSTGAVRAGLFASYIVRAIDPDASKLINVSTRVRVETGASVGIAGFVVSGDQPRRVVIRALGPSLLASGVPGALANPQLEVRNSEGVLIAQNDDWQTVQPVSEVVGVSALNVGETPFAPSDPTEAAVALSLPAGSYTAIVRGANAGMGVGLVEVYDLDPANADSQAVNVSTRGQVGTGDGVMIGGFVVRGAKPITVVVRAIGPSLAAQGVAGALEDPTLEVRDAPGNVVASVDDTSAADAQILGDLLPIDSRESAVKLSLAPGSYTAIVRGKGGAGGVALVEVFER